MAAKLRASGGMSHSFQNVLEHEANPVAKVGEEAQASPLESEGERMVPRVIQVGTIGELLGWVPPQELTEGPEEGLAQRWETQWQEILKAVQPLPSGWGSQQPSNPSPWGSSEAAINTSQWPCGEGITQVLVDDDGEVPGAFSNPAKEENGTLEKEVMGRDTTNTETRRRHFRQFGYQDAEGPQEACKRLRELCRRWLKPEKRTKEQILELLILEQFLNILPQEMQSWIRVRCPQACFQAVALAEDFLRGQQREVKVLGPCEEEVVVVSPEAEWSPLEDGLDPSSSGKLCLDSYAVSAGERPVNGNKAGSSQQGSPRLPVLLGTLLGQPGSLESSRGLEQENGTEPTVGWDEAMLCSEGVYETVVRLEEHGHWCLECGESFQDALQLIRHQRTHTGRKRPECPECGKSFRDVSHVLRHQTVHTGEKPYSCSECGQSFTQKPALNRHLRKHLQEQNFTGIDITVRTPRTPMGRKRPECLKCGKSFRDVSQVLRHQTVHTGERPYSCLECGQSFTQKPALNRHQRRHLAIQFCAGDGTVCAKQERASVELAASQHRPPATSQESVPGAHASRYALESWSVQDPPWEAAPVSARGATRKKLNRRGQRNYWCFICIKGFRDKADLVRHERIHTGEKPYLCLDCGKQFSYTSSLYKHQLIHQRPLDLAAKPFTEEPLICRHHDISDVQATGTDGKGVLCNGVKVEGPGEEPCTGKVVLLVGSAAER
ncbi:zinc finger and SCAN domain-containing protein 21-like isoform X1 [Rhineura floridana]|uniref:zinc finger and SCAN domain-containing protein 21-like isoform X1 n=1 Tax=Rhineura floridana TaxID=261503 RepID=UPI002AC88BC7|nr:zinc finger and SCAN domain-containing protein 21-like isoform X1 [Rhineura floridana]XP_061476009.1 zinc finger and SCAN domain-containing protein 21-like isoform X1 [Rhineura floridana]XP_061476010.1 zinc finger and SCAN domain-containing protein 21-like isoform X1 [Rhineura floridana]XP_061476011.1 zinc finger and SCAN domain-containing protein 21-like isoform X1 [Rhineura floridana]